jgi:hypothetical protein
MLWMSSSLLDIHSMLDKVSSKKPTEEVPMTATMTQDVQEQVLGAIRKSQEMTLDAVKKVVETVAAAQAKLPGAPFDRKLPGLPPAGKLPFADKLPEPEAVVSSAFDFFGQLLAGQRKFATELLKVTAGLRPAAEPGPAAPAEPAAE